MKTTEEFKEWFKDRAWYKDGFFWRHPDSGDAGDLIFNTMYKIMQDGDVSDWAKGALSSCADLLIEGKRWVNRLNQDNTAKNRLQWWFNEGYTRPQDDMTRDPYIAFYACCVHLEMMNMIEEVIPVWYVYRANFWNWRKYLITDEDKYLKRYLFWSHLSTSNKVYVERLRSIMNSVI